MGELVQIVLVVPFGGYLFWLLFASICRTFWKFFDFPDGGAVSSGHGGQVSWTISNLLAGLLGALVGWGFFLLIPVLEYRTCGAGSANMAGGQRPIGEKFSIFHRQMHQWVTATIRPTLRAEILESKLAQPAVRRTFG